MAARGTESKAKIEKKLFEIFEGIFKNGKEIRIPMYENGEEIQIKIALTAAKDNISHGDESTEVSSDSVPDPSNNIINFQSDSPTEPTEEEKQRLQELMKLIGKL